MMTDDSSKSAGVNIVESGLNFLDALFELSQGARELRAVRAHRYIWDTFEGICLSAPGSVDQPQDYAEDIKLEFNDIPIKIDRTLPDEELQAT